MPSMPASDTLDSSTGVVTFTAAGTCTVSASEAGNANYGSALATPQTIIVKALQTVTITSTKPASAVVGQSYAVTATSVKTGTTTSTGLTPVISVSGGACTVSGNTVSFNAAGSCTINAAVTGDATYADASATAQSVTVGKGTQQISIALPSNPVVGATFALTATSVNAVTKAPTGLTPLLSVSGGCTLNAGTLTFTAAATCTINASEAGNANYVSLTVSQSVTVGKGSQTLASDAIPAPVNPLVGGSYRPALTASSAGVTPTLTSTTTSICSVSSGTVSFLTAGTCTLSATAAGDSNYLVSNTVTLSFQIKAPQTVTITSTRPLNDVGRTYDVTATSVKTGTSTPTGLTPVISVSGGACSVSGATVTFTAVGTCTIDASVTGDATYADAFASPQSFTVNKGQQTITITSTPTNPFVGSAYKPTATSVVAGTTNPTGLTPSFSSIGVCTTSFGTVTFTNVGTCTVFAASVNKPNYADATTTQIIAVKAVQTVSITSTPPANPVVGGTYAVTANSVISGTNNPTYLTPVISVSGGVCTLNSSTGVVTFTAVGTCTVSASEAGDSTYGSASATPQIIVVKGTQTLASAAIPAPVSPAVGGSYKPVLTASSAGVTPTLTSTTPSICSVDPGATVSFLAAGTCTLSATAPATTLYAPSNTVTQSFTVAKGTQTLISTAIPAPASPVVSGSYKPTLANSSAGLAPSLTSTSGSICSVGSDGTVSFLAAGTCSLSATVAGNDNYLASNPVIQSFTVSKGSQTVSIASTAPSNPQVGGTYQVVATSVISPLASSSPSIKSGLQ